MLRSSPPLSTSGCCRRRAQSGPAVGVTRGDPKSCTGNWGGEAAPSASGPQSTGMPRGKRPDHQKGSSAPPSAPPAGAGAMRRKVVGVYLLQQEGIPERGTAGTSTGGICAGLRHPHQMKKLRFTEGRSEPWKSLQAVREGQRGFVSRAERGKNKQIPEKASVQLEKSAFKHRLEPRQLSDLPLLPAFLLVSPLHAAFGSTRGLLSRKRKNQGQFGAGQGHLKTPRVPGSTPLAQEP